MRELSQAETARAYHERLLAEGGYGNPSNQRYLIGLIQAELREIGEFSPANQRRLAQLIELLSEVLYWQREV